MLQRPSAAGRGPRRQQAGTNRGRTSAPAPLAAAWVSASSMTVSVSAARPGFCVEARGGGGAGACRHTPEHAADTPEHAAEPRGDSSASATSCGIRLVPVLHFACTFCAQKTTRSPIQLPPPQRRRRRLRSRPRRTAHHGAVAPAARVQCMCACAAPAPSPPRPRPAPSA